MRRDVEFLSEGSICRGWFYTPEQSASSGARWPAVVMAHGFSAVKEMRLDRFAETFAAAGLASLVFDYRGLGSSEGEPRQDLDPYAHIADYRNAISYARQLREVDGARLGVWGTSYSGAHALMVAALDRRVRAVVSQVPLIDGWETMGMLAGADMRTALVEQLIEERERIFAGDAPTMIPVIDTVGGGVAAMSTPDAVEWFQRAARSAPTWTNKITLRSLERMLEYAPGRFIDRIAPTPLLLIAAAHDVTPLELVERACARAGEPKRLEILPIGHFDVYEPPHVATAARLATEWFTRYLG